MWPTTPLPPPTTPTTSEKKTSPLCQSNCRLPDTRTSHSLVSQTNLSRQRKYDCVTDSG
jgi:hypothetical protein